ncbi:MarR family winged helix-turn-helix transcriptional regulator [Pseudozobellia sp. WGM2]|uniref:MarR family winged helix-turn-helix transcriptional regulator n=1 Tax=Pseudozobellia sp. WGM2 TaxID=2787625 RepID=UPI001AE030A4|nr:MarR family transcriptional regulator [Pseudozobellia sp. WGM2]
MNVEKILKTDKKMPLESRTLIHLSLVHNKVGDIINSTLRPFEVSTQQFNVLRILRGQKGKPANLSTLNERMVTKMSNTTRLVDKLILKEYVDRTVCPSNRRKVEIRITEKGEKVLLQMDAAMSNAEKEILENLTESDLKNFNELLDKF